MKTCTSCNKLKSTDQFNKQKSNKDGLRIICRECQREYQKKLYNLKKDKNIEITEKNCIQCEENKPIGEFNLQKNSKDGLRPLCKICQSVNRKKYHALPQNKEKSHKLAAIYYEKNKKQIAERVDSNKIQRNNRYIERYHSDIQFRWMNKLHRNIYTTMQYAKDEYCNKSIQCNKPFLINWMKFQFGPNMSWHNYGEKWEIEHIIPFNAFDLTKKEEREICCHWTNLQPMCKIQNKKKRDKIIVLHFMNSIVMTHRFIQQKSPSAKQGYIFVKKRLEWMKKQNV